MPAVNKAIIWIMLPRTGTEPTYQWSTWTTTCGRYRIEYYSDTGHYTAKRLSPSLRDAASGEKNWITVNGAQPTLDAAMDDVNTYHCLTHKLVLVP